MLGYDFHPVLFVSLAKIQVRGNKTQGSSFNKCDWKSLCVHPRESTESNGGCYRRHKASYPGTEWLELWLWVPCANPFFSVMIY